MRGSDLFGILGVALLAVGWVGVQAAWRRVFPDSCSDPDVLAGRMGCHGPGCNKDCDRRSEERAETVEEEFR